MPKIIFDEKEILAGGNGVINASGNIYIENGRKYPGKRVRWVILKDEGLDSIPKSHETPFSRTGHDAVIATP